VSFPEAEPLAADIAQSARTAMLAGIAGIVLGLGGLVIGILAFRAARR
jgi:hypothetical protein